MKKISFALILVFCMACNKSVPTEVLVLPTLHKAHEMNSNYTYDDLMEIIKDFNPDVIGVEIRPEDMEVESEVLATFYPKEMVSIRDSFKDKAYGIDFYSEDTQDEVVEAGMFRDTTREIGRANRLSQNMKMDSVIVEKHKKLGLDKILKEQQRIAMTYSPDEFLKGEYDSLTELQFILEDSLLKGTPYEEYAVFNSRRDRRISQNALKLIEENPEKRILILVGANHRNRLIDLLEQEDQKKVKLIEDLQFMQE